MTENIDINYKAIYRLLNSVSPLESDCGLLCGAACCRSGSSCGADDGLVIYMLPGEESAHDMSDGWLTWHRESTQEAGLPESWGSEFYTVTCRGAEECKRELRPIQCRTFPLMPYISEEGRLEMLYSDIDLPYSCPLIDREIPLNDSFVHATRTVWKHLMRIRSVRDLVEQDSEEVRLSAEY